MSRINAQHASDEYTRYAPLAATGAETHERVADLKSTRDQAAATLAANNASIAAARTQIASYTAQLQQARAQLEAAQASAAQAQLDLDNTIVRSTLAGRVGDRTVRVGQYVQPGTRLLTVVPVDSIYLVANFKETQIGNMRIGQPVELHVDALPDGALSGVVDSFAPARRAIRTAAARKRDRQLHEDRPARAGAHPPRRGRPRAAHAAAGAVGDGRRRYALGPRRDASWLNRPPRCRCRRTRAVRA